MYSTVFSTVGSPAVKNPINAVPFSNAFAIEYDEKGNLYEIRVREEISVAFQHELDHLEGILFTDKIDPKNPFKGQDIYRSI